MPIAHKPQNVIDVWNKYNLYSQKWGLKRNTPLPYADKWHRLSEAAKAIPLSRDARKRLGWFVWYETTGRQNARVTCRHFGIAPKVFYFWKKRFDEQRLELLEERSRRPKHVRASMLTGEEEIRICQLRREYLHYSKMKLAILYRERHGTPISSWKIQRVIILHGLYPNRRKTEKAAKRRQRAVAKRRITHLVTQPHTGFLFSIDTVVLWLYGKKRYVLTAIDRHSRFAFARMYTTHSSKSAADFLRRLYLLMDGRLLNIQTDNGSEFHLYFEAAIREMKLEHWWSRTHTPKDNAICERFNRTLQEEFIQNGNAEAIPSKFNAKLLEWLIEYDFHRPHAGLHYKRPIEIACNDPNVLPMYPSRTSSCAHAIHGVQCVPFYFQFPPPHGLCR